MIEEEVVHHSEGDNIIGILKEIVKVILRFS
jgi:hypothetical protein